MAMSMEPLRAKEEVSVVVREYDEERDREAVEEMERRCEVGLQGKSSLVTDNLGDPLGRIRHFSKRVMMVAEYGREGEIAGVIRGCVNTVTNGSKVGEFPLYVNLAYILGLRVSPTRRRCGIGAKLVKEVEEWCTSKGADYAYMATDINNKASVRLFTLKCNYTKFRTPTVLVQPVHAHRKRPSSSVAIVQLPPPFAGSVYRQVFSEVELFPKDIDAILLNNLNKGTFMAIPKKSVSAWEPQSSMPPCYAMLSVWNATEVFKVKVQGASKLTKACCVGSRVLDAHMPWLRLPSIPNLFRPFGFYFLFGLYMDGKGCLPLMRSLCHMAHNMATDDVECGAIVAEVAQHDPVLQSIPHWKRFSWDEDLWCIKKLNVHHGTEEATEWTTFRPSSKIFVDPRDV